LIGRLILKIDRPDIVGKVVSYDATFDDYSIKFKLTGESLWTADWSAYLLFKNLDDGWYLIDSSPVMEVLLGFDEGIE
jgi:hypothetical protein